MTASPRQSSDTIISQDEKINFCIYSGAAKDAKVPAFYMQKTFIKSALKIIFIFLLAFIAGQFIMKWSLQKIDNEISSRLSTPQAEQQKQEQEQDIMAVLESKFMPIQTNFDTEF